MLRDARDHMIAFFFRVGRFAVAIVSIVSGDDIGRVALFGLGYAERDVAFAERVPCGIGKPGFVAKLERSTHGSGQSLQKLLEHGLIHLEIWRELEEQRAESSSALQTFQCADKTLQEFFRAL